MSRDLVGRIKRSFVVRILLWPVMIIKKYIEYYQYQRSECHFLIRKYKDVHKGKRCFIVGNGPSLKASDLDSLKDEITFATNGIYYMFNNTAWRPTYYLACDVEGLHNFLPQILPQYRGICFLSTKASNILKNRPNNVIYSFMSNKNFPINIYNDKSSHISEDVSCYFSRGYTVTFDAIQLAIYMGCKEIYLIGVDFNYALLADRHGKIKRVDGIDRSHFNETKPSNSFLNYYSTLYAYEVAQKYCNDHNIVIKNATRGGKLETFERINFDDIIADRR